MLRKILSWKYPIAVAIILMGAVYVSRQEQCASDQYEKKCTQLNGGTVSPSTIYEDCEKGADNATRHLPSWYRVFSWPDGITTWAILLTLLVVTEQTRVIRRQALSMRRQTKQLTIAAKAARKSATAQMNADRAWVLVGEVINPPLLHESVDKYAPGVVWHITVAGNTPARLVRQRYRCHIVPAIPGSDPPQPQLDAVPNYDVGTNTYEANVVRAPGHKSLVSIPLESGILGGGELLDLKRGDSVLCAYGCIEYQDAFGRDGVTKFCVLYRFQFGGVITSPDGVVLNPPGFRTGGPAGYNETT